MYFPYSRLTTCKFRVLGKGFRVQVLGKGRKANGVNCHCVQGLPEFVVLLVSI